MDLKEIVEQWKQDPNYQTYFGETKPPITEPTKPPETGNMWQDLGAKYEYDKALADRNQQQAEAALPFGSEYAKIAEITWNPRGKGKKPKEIRSGNIFSDEIREQLKTSLPVQKEMQLIQQELEEKKRQFEVAYSKYDPLKVKRIAKETFDRDMRIAENEILDRELMRHWKRIHGKYATETEIAQDFGRARRDFKEDVYNAKRRELEQNPDLQSSVNIRHFEEMAGEPYQGKGHTFVYDGQTYKVKNRYGDFIEIEPIQTKETGKVLSLDEYLKNRGGQ